MSRWSVLGVVGVATIATSQCFDPTEIELDVSTNANCKDTQGTTISIGSPGQEPVNPPAMTSACDGGEIGTLYVTPGTNLSGPVGVRVVLGVDTPVAQCAPQYSGCIVARRSLEFVPHRPLVLPIALDQACIGNPCDPNSTCVNGQCVDAGLTCDPSCVPDAGSCAPAGPIFVKALTAPATPHLVKTNAGYAIGFDTAPANDPKREYHVVAVDALGNAVGNELLIASLAVNHPSGPLGTRGATYAALVNTSGTDATVIELNASGTPLPGGSTAASALPLHGLVFDASTSEYVFVTVDVAGQPRFNVLRATGNAVDSPTTIGPSGPIDLALVRYGSSYFVAMHDPPNYPPTETCQVYAAKRNYGTSSFSVGPVSVFSKCGAVRVAPGPTETLFASEDLNFYSMGLGASYNLAVRFGAATASAAFEVGSLDNEAFVPLLSGTNNFRLVWSVVGVIKTATFDAAATAAPPVNDLAMTQATSSAPLFDAVADPGATSYVVVYWANGASGPGLYFLRRCG